MSLSPIKKVLGETVNWPNRKMFKVERLSPNGSTYEANISPSELEIVNMLSKLEMILKKNCIKEISIDVIRETVEKYGEDQYSLGYDEAQLED